MKKISLFLIFALAATLAANAQNPIIRDQFSADPTARVFNGRVYVYPSHDIPSPVEHLKEWFCMADYHVFSSDDLIHWTDHGVIVDQKDVPWGNPEGYSMWAPDCVYQDGKYYFYFPNARKPNPEAENPMLRRGGFGIGVAVADSPEGPFTCLDEPVQGAFGIDPCCMQTSSGDNYLVFGGGRLFIGKLKSNMTEFEDRPAPVTTLPEGFVEGPFAFEHNGKYYLTYPWVRNDGGTETLAYAMSDNPMGPYEYKGLIMKESPTGCWTNHHSIVKFKDQWYLFYHHNDYSPNFDKNRSVRVDSLFFNEDGTIREVIPTLRGVGLYPANEQIEIDRYSEIGGGAKIDYIDSTNTFLGWKTVFAPKGYVRYNAVDFSAKGSGLSCSSNRWKKVAIKAVAPAEAVVSIRIDAVDGKEVCKAVISPCGDWTVSNYAVSKSVSKKHDLFVVCEQGSVEIDWVKFE